MPKNLVVLSDGTWNTWRESEATNVVRLSRTLIQSGKQKYQYDAGVGTDFRKFTGGAFGVGISDNIKELYEFLCSNYEPGDALFLFGFSRGAFTVRSLAGMLERCGILHNVTQASLNTAFELYTKPPSAQSRDFKASHSTNDYLISVLGVWDTVGALGVPFATLNRLNPFSHRFHDTRLSARVRLALQALSIDENRFTFRPTLWEHPAPTMGDAGVAQTIHQVWFAGAHSDVGGGYQDTGLSDITLSWMIREIQAHNTGLLFKPESEWGFQLAPDPTTPSHDERKGFYRLWKSHHRHIADESLVHETVAERMGLLGDAYQPQNLPANVTWVDVV